MPCLLRLARRYSPGNQSGLLRRSWPRYETDPRHRSEYKAQPIRDLFFEAAHRPELGPR